MKHPARYVQSLSEGQLPIKDTEVLSTQDRHTEKIMLGLRLREGIPAEWIAEPGQAAVEAFLQRGLLERSDGRISVSDSGRLLADGIITDLLIAEEG